VRHLGLEEAQVHKGGSAVVLAFDVFHPGAFDPEDRHPLPVDAPDLDVAQLAAAHEPQRAQEEVLGLDHGFLPVVIDCPGSGGERSSKVEIGLRGRPLLSSRAGVGDPPRFTPDVGPLFLLPPPFKKPLKTESLSRGLRAL